MKRIIPVLLLAAVLFGCGQQKKDPTKKAPQKAAHATNNAPLFHYGNPVLLQYDRYIAGLDTQLVNMGSQAVDTFQAFFKNQAPAVCDTAFYIFNQFHSRLSSYLDSHTEADSIEYLQFFYAEENGKPYPLSQKHKAIKRALDNNGFGMEPMEGAVLIVQNKQFMVQRFGKYVSAPMKQYLTQLTKEQKEGFESDGGLVIEPVILAGRTVWWEQFSKTIANTNFLYAKETADQYSLMLYVLMKGMDNTGVNDYYNDSIPNGYILSAYFQKAWTYVQEKHPQSNTNAVITPFLNAWLKKDSTEIKQVINSFEKEHRSPWQ
ncbi:MAG TPA: hypothetical protein VF008_10425 [Niastella sp.]